MFVNEGFTSSKEGEYSWQASGTEDEVVLDAIPYSDVDTIRCILCPD